MTFMVQEMRDVQALGPNSKMFVVAYGRYEDAVNTPASHLGYLNRDGVIRSTASQDGNMMGWFDSKDEIIVAAGLYRERNKA